MRLLGCVATQGHDMAMQGHDTAQGRACDTASRTATLPGVGHDTALWAPRHGTTARARAPERTMCASWVNWLCTWCTQLVFLGSVHCFSHCLDTVHEHYS